MKATTVRLAYGRTVNSVEIPTRNLLRILAPAAVTEAADETVLVAKALAQPIDSPRLRDLAQPDQQVVIVTSDLTRPCPSERLLPPVLDELSAAGVPDEAITIVLGLGLHRPMTAQELEAAVGPEIFGRVKVINHDTKATVWLGVTPAGTPVEFFRPVVEADLRVCLGNLEFHYFVGYSGGAKAIFPGVASVATVQANHAMMVCPEASAGRLEGNPVRADIEEGVAMLGVDFILNVVVGAGHQIVGAVAGDVTAAHRLGCEMVAQWGTVPVPALADLVLVSAGGHPKDLNLYQAQKALDNAAHAVRDGGIIILVAECGEGYGNETFEEWMIESGGTQGILERIQEHFVLGGHKAAAIASVLTRAKVLLVSALPAESVQRSGLVPCQNLVQAVETAFGELGPDAQVTVMPQGGSILPVVA